MPYKKILEIADILNGFAFQSKRYVENGIRVIRIANVQDGKIVDEQPCFYPSETRNEIEKYMLKEGDLLVSLTGNVGRVGLIPGDMLPAALNQRVCCLRLKKDNIDLKYLFLYLRRKDFVRECIKASKGVAQLNLSTKWLENYEIPLPSLSEQKRIVDKIEELFSELDSAIETLKKTKEQLAVYRQSVLKESFEDLQQETSLDQCIVEKPRNGYSEKGVDYETKYRNLTLTATTSGFFKEDCFKYIDINIDDDSYLWVKKNDILIQRANTLEYVGTSVVYTGEDNKYVYPDLIMKCRAKPEFFPHFLVYQLQSLNCRKYFREHATGTAGSMPKINQKVVCSAPIKIANKNIQQKIVQNINAQFKACESIEKTVNEALIQADAMRQSILKKAFEGGL